MSELIEIEFGQAAIDAAMRNLQPGQGLALGPIPCGARYVRTYAKADGTQVLVFERKAPEPTLSVSVGYAEHVKGMAGPVVRTGWAAR